MTEAEIKRYATEALKASDADFSVSSVAYDGAEAWNVTMKCPRCGNFHFNVHEWGDQPAQGQIETYIRTHLATH